MSCKKVLCLGLIARLARIGRVGLLDAIELTEAVDEKAGALGVGG